MTTHAEEEGRLRVADPPGPAGSRPGLLGRLGQAAARRFRLTLILWLVAIAGLGDENALGAWGDVKPACDRGAVEALGEELADLALAAREALDQPAFVQLALAQAVGETQ